MEQDFGSSTAAEKGKHWGVRIDVACSRSKKKAGVHGMGSLAVVTSGRGESADRNALAGSVFVTL